MRYVNQQNTDIDYLRVGICKQRQMKLLDGYLKRKNGSMSTSSRQTASDSCCESRRQHKYNIDKKSLQKIDVKPQQHSDEHNRLLQTRERMLLVTKKPIENQMHCFLEIMKGKIDNEIVKCQELPLPFDMQIQSWCLPRVKCWQISRTITSSLRENRKISSGVTAETSQFIDEKQLDQNTPNIQLNKNSDTKQIDNNTHNKQLVKHVDHTQNDYKTNIKQYKSKQLDPIVSLTRRQRIKSKPKVNERTRRSISIVGRVSSEVDPIRSKSYLMQHPQGHCFWYSNKHNIHKPQGKDCSHKQLSALTASSFFVLNCNTLQPIAWKNSTQKIQIASLSKIMTCYLSLLICKKYNINLHNHYTRVTDKAVSIDGTTAQLQAGDIISIYNLLFALMLPSGNDAAFCLGQSLGKVLQQHIKRQTKRSFLETFIWQMNVLSRQLQLDQQWYNCSGLSCNPNFVSPYSLALLTAVAVLQPLFDKIVNTQHYQTQIKNDRFGLTRKIVWKNTNKLLQSGWHGVKTGTTQTAGYCLAARKNNILICVFNCSHLSKRFGQCAKLYDHFRNHQTLPTLTV